jgi:hypothetical protein
MPRRVTLTDRQKDALLRLPISQTDLLRHYTLSDEDLGHIRQRRRAHNRFGFALQLCVLRYPGRVLAPGELIPAEVVEFIGAQLGLQCRFDLVDYASREETRHEHLAELRALYGFRTFSGRGARELRDWLFRDAEMAVSNEDVAQSLRGGVPAHPHGSSRDIDDRAAVRRGPGGCRAADRDEDRRVGWPSRSQGTACWPCSRTRIEDRVTRFVWLRQFEPGVELFIGQPAA